MMAAKRVARSAVNWAGLAEKVPVGQREAFRNLKATTDKYIQEIADLPETLPKINFAEYQRRVANTALVTQFEKLYQALEVPYPKDSANTSAKLQAAEKAELQKKDVFVATKNLRSQELNKVLEALDSVPPPEKMTKQMFNYYFPQAAINPNRENPGFYPRDRSFQFDSPEFGPYYNTPYDKKGLRSEEEGEEIFEEMMAQEKLEKARHAEEAKQLEEKAKK
ncbi:Atp5hp [Mactra antiquata]